MTIAELRVYDQGVAPGISVVSGSADTYCLRSTTGGTSAFKNGPDARGHDRSLQLERRRDPPATGATVHRAYDRRSMTWLPVTVGDGCERDAVLGLKQEPYDVMRDVLTAAWVITDPQVLELCRLRLAQLAGARAELAGVDQDTLAELEAWYSSPGLTGHERAALAFAEQYHLDHQLLGNGARAELEQHLSRRELVNFVWALHMNDAYIRVLSLLDIAPDPASAPAAARTCSRRRAPGLRGAQVRRREDEDEAPVRSLMDPEFEAAYRRLNPVVVRQSLVDEVTSEAVRLRNARFQGCLY